MTTSTKPPRNPTRLSELGTTDRCRLPCGRYARFQFRMGPTVFMRLLDAGGNPDDHRAYYESVGMPAETAVTEVKALAFGAADTQPVVDPAAGRAVGESPLFDLGGEA